jgi:hypothetical protein
MIAPNTSSATYDRLRRSSAGLGVAPVDGAVCASGLPSSSTLFSLPIVIRDSSRRRRDPEGPGAYLRHPKKVVGGVSLDVS